MYWLRHHRALVAEGIFLLVLFFASQLPLRDFDLWFHIKSGELFVSLGRLQQTELFSYSAYGREWITFEWLFQVVIYGISRIGLWAIPPFTSIFVVITLGTLLATLRYIFQVPLLARLVLVGIFWVSTYEFNTARPHTVAYAFLAIHLFLILARVVKHKRWIWISPVLTLVWSNVHSTGFFAWGFLLVFAGVALAQYLRQKNTIHLHTMRELLILCGINAAVTLLPPMGMKDYQLLWRFFREREFLGYFISEWGPPQDNPFGFRLYTASIIVSFTMYLLLLIKTRAGAAYLTAIPFIIMAIGGYSATRNIYLGTLGIIILTGLTVGAFHQIMHLSRNRWIMGILVGLTVLYGWIYMLKLDSVHANRLYYPIGATEFIKTHAIQGNMFNDYNYGSYMLYRLYPHHQVFIDGRADVYECCEMRDYLKLAANKHMDDETYRKFLDAMWDAYDISYAVIVTTKHNVMRRIAALLNTDPQWILVFWDDDSQIFVRRDGKNEDIISRFGAKAATPYLRVPYISGKEEQAFAEYDRMDSIAPSARTSNALGFFLMKNGAFEEAKDRFEEAISLDPTFESPYMNLAELAVRDGEINDARTLYARALRLAPDRGLIYIRLGELTVLATGDKAHAKRIWKNGISQTVDADARKKLEELIQSP